MKFTIHRQEFAELVGRIQNIVAPKTPIPLLSNFLLEATDSRIILTATDLTVTLRCTGSANVTKPGVITIPARRFGQLLREITAPVLEIESNEKNVIQVVANSSTFRMHGLAKGEFPDLPDLSSAQVVSFHQADLREALSRTAFAVAKDDTRFLLTGISCQLSGNQAIFVGTDAKRLARTSIPSTSSVDSTYECVLPIKAVDEILKILQKDTEQVKMYLAEGKIAVEAGDFLVVTKLLSGEYPDVDRVIPTQSEHVVALHREELMTLLRQVSLFTAEENYSARFTFTPGELQLNATTMDIGEGKVSMAVNYAGERFDVAFNPQYFLDILRHSKNECVNMAFIDAYNPAIIADGEIHVEQKALPNPLFVLMPLRLE